MPTILDIFGLRFFFYANEHRPIHIHVENGDGRAKIEIEPEIKVVQNQGIKQKDLKKTIQLIEIYKEDIVSRWKEFHGEE